MGSPRFLAAAVLLPGGKVLVAGGVANDMLVTAELYDPAGADGGGSFSPTGDLAYTRTRFSGVALLPSGRVLFAGGHDAADPTASAELYEPAGNGGAGAFRPTGSMATGRAGPMAALLPDGRVLVAGGGVAYGINDASAELFDPAGDGGTGTFSPAGSMAYRRSGGTATLLLDGRVLISGGNGSMGDPLYQGAEVFVP
jgi:hypothetical protein